jgi:hypothetical protein
MPQVLKCWLCAPFLSIWGMQTSVNTRPQPRANVISDSLTKLSTSRNTYANHHVLF